MPLFLPRSRATLWVALLLAVAIVVTAVWVVRTSTTRLDEAAFSDVLLAARRGDLTDVAIVGDELVVTLRDGRRARTIPPEGYVASNPAFVADLATAGVRVAVQPEGLLSRESVGPILLLLLTGAGLIVGLGIVTGRWPLFGARHATARRETHPITFADVAGVDEARDEVQEIVEFLRDPGRFRAAGGRIPRGVLLVGPPGTGKTLLARAIAGEARVPFLFASGSDFVEKFVGVGASRVRHLFRDARRHPACIVFIDELDAVGRQRGARVAAHEEREQTLNQLLVEMDGFDPQRNVVVIAATNRVDILDAALLRPGRFDRQVHVGLADIKGREAILRVHTRKLSLAPDVDLRSIARGTPGFSGADLANLVNEAALFAGRERRREVNAADFDAARDKVLMGVERRSLVMTPSERLTCAYHEAGHAIVAAYVPHTDPLHKVTIIPRGRALGLTMQLPASDRHTHSKDYLNAQITILMAGRVAEEIFLQQMTSGAANDIERATDIARRMVCVFGMSPLGMQSFGGGTREGDRPAQMSEYTARRVDEYIDQFLTEGYQRARAIIDERRSALDALAKELLAVESLDADGIKRVLAEHDPAIV